MPNRVKHTRKHEVREAPILMASALQMSKFFFVPNKERLLVRGLFALCGYILSLIRPLGGSELTMARS